MENQKVWFVTGASKGLGLSLVKQLLSAGYNVAATSRTVDSLSKAVGTEESENFLPLEVSITTEQSVKDAVSKTIEKFGTIDVLVNNAGYGLFGAVEELSDEETRRNFDINVFGSLNVIRQILPYMRAKGSGKIFNISSIGGFTADFPGVGIYCSTKFAVAGFTEALASEVKELGISATVVYPGYFRTDFLSSESMVAPKNAIEDYAGARASVQAHENEIAGNQPGDPQKAVAVLIKIASEENTPVHLFLGKDSYEMAQGKIQTMTKNLEEYKAITVSTDFDS
ncbi:oxidoreductase [Dyadobacter frigoris]|uniref:SDR family NAD(P)-dependent oxidoreductase n=1 Tax=Dyadobacter frigoris TaxID=2576211 RepID=A0A4U6CZT5_9BACT|nr:oxidoreductase [Dyadobacter frigoris]TKT90302.1 SDR family NAD(P)-dependent oxidoreductase [Dyadobacter frigoris]GLU52538.1 short-chain dehydrogenase/reductase [Dyadobacter frigoris]